MSKGSPQPGKQLKLTKSAIDSITEPGAYPDTDLTGFKLWVGKSGSKSYQLVGKVKGQPRPVYITIGKHGDPWTPDAARKEAEKLRLLMRQGVNPNEATKEKREHAEAAREVDEAAKKVKELTVSAAFAEFLGKNQKESTARVYRLVVGKHFKDWLNKPLVDITKDDIITRYDLIHSSSPSSAAHALRILRAIFNTARIKHGDKIPDLAKISPVAILSHARKSWNSVDARDDYIEDEDLPKFYKAVMKLTSTKVRDYLLVCILTGLRKGEVCSLSWERNIDLRKKTITIQREQAKNNQRHILVMSDYLYDLFLVRWQIRENDFVFPGVGASGHLSDPNKAIDDVIQMSGIKPFSSHSLRRTFATAADSLGYNLQEVQRLLNHKPGTVTQKHYIQNVAERTKEPMQRINDHLLKLMGAKESSIQEDVSNVVPMSQAKASTQ